MPKLAESNAGSIAEFRENSANQMAQNVKRDKNWSTVEESSARVRIRNQTLVLLAEPAIAVAREPIVECIADRPRHDDEAVQQEPWASQATCDA